MQDYTAKLATKRGGTAAVKKQLPEMLALAYVSMGKKKWPEYHNFGQTAAQFLCVNKHFNQSCWIIADELQWRSILIDELMQKPGMLTTLITKTPLADIDFSGNFQNKLQSALTQFTKWKSENEDRINPLKAQARTVGDKWLEETKRVFQSQNKSSSSFKMVRWGERVTDANPYITEAREELLQLLLQQTVDDNDPRHITFAKAFKETLKDVTKRHQSNRQKGPPSAEDQTLANILWTIDADYLFEECIELYARAKELKNTKAAIVYPTALNKALYFVIERIALNEYSERYFKFCQVKLYEDELEEVLYSDSNSEHAYSDDETSPRTGKKSSPKLIHRPREGTDAPQIINDSTLSSGSPGSLSDEDFSSSVIFQAVKDCISGQLYDLISGANSVLDRKTIDALTIKFNDLKQYCIPDKRSSRPPADVSSASSGFSFQPVNIIFPFKTKSPAVLDEFKSFMKEFHVAFNILSDLRRNLFNHFDEIKTADRVYYENLKRAVQSLENFIEKLTDEFKQLPLTLSTDLAQLPASSTPPSPTDRDDKSAAATVPSISPANLIRARDDSPIHGDGRRSAPPFIPSTANLHSRNGQTNLVLSSTTGEKAASNDMPGKNPEATSLKCSSSSGILAGNCSSRSPSPAPTTSPLPAVH